MLKDHSGEWVAIDRNQARLGAFTTKAAAKIAVIEAVQNQEENEL